jgi:hypothetical protein
LEYRSTRPRNWGGCRGAARCDSTCESWVQEAFRLFFVASTLKSPFFEQLTGLLSCQNHSVRIDMIESLRVARRDGEAVFGTVLGLPVIPNTPDAEFWNNKLFGNAETLIQR